MPIHQSQLQRTAFNALDQNALWAQGTVIEPICVRVLQRFGNVANKFQALADAEQGSMVTQQVIKAHRLGIVVKHQRWPQLRVLVVVDFKDAGMINTFKNLELAAGLPASRGARFGARSAGNGVDANTPVDSFDADVVRLPVLKTFPFRQQFAELVVAHLPVLV